MPHVAIIMDGNGRWAAARGLPRTAGHRAGAATMRRVVEAAPGFGIGTLTLYAFSSNNWQRPRPEVEHLMALLRGYLEGEIARCVAHGVRVTVIGRRDRLPPAVTAAIEVIEAATAAGGCLHLRLAIDYSSREAILAAARCLPARDGEGRRDSGNGVAVGPAAVEPDAEAREAFGRRVAMADARGPAPGDVDLLIRAGGERRLSDFLLWECAYAELWFTDVPWPEFTTADLEAAMAEFYRRERRFGDLPAEAAPRKENA